MESNLQYSDVHLTNLGIKEYKIYEYAHTTSIKNYLVNNTNIEKPEFDQYGTNCGNIEIEEFFTRSITSVSSL